MTVSEPSAVWPPAAAGGAPADPSRDQKIFEARVDVTSDAVKAHTAHGYKVDEADHEAQIAADNAETDTFNAWATANREADIANLQQFHSVMSTLAVGSVDRARASADTVQKASAAIVSLYGIVLGLVFSVTSNPLPVRGVVAPIFLGLAVVLSTAYLAYIGPPADGYTLSQQPVTALEPKTYQRLNLIIKATKAVAERRAGVLRASVVALGVGLACIALPFVDFTYGGDSSAGSVGVAAATPTEPAWPTPAEDVPVELNKIRYQAEVDEVAALRSSASSSSPATSSNRDDSADLTVAIVALLFGAIVVAVVPRLVRGE